MKDGYRRRIACIQAYYARAHCAVCGKYLGLPEDQAPDKRHAFLSDVPRDRVATLPEYEMWALVALLKMAADHFGKHIYEDIDFAPLVPDVEQRRAIMRRYHAWNGDPEVFEEDEAPGREYPFWTYSSALDYFAHRLAPDIEREIREAEARARRQSRDRNNG